MKRLGGFLIAGTLLSVLFVLFNLLAAWLGGGRPIDATADNRYTLSAKVASRSRFAQTTGDAAFLCFRRFVRL